MQNTCSSIEPLQIGKGNRRPSDYLLSFYIVHENGLLSENANMLLLASAKKMTAEKEGGFTGEIATEALVQAGRRPSTMILAASS
jgi:triosephosphate isomerase